MSMEIELLLMPSAGALTFIGQWDLLKLEKARLVRQKWY